MIHKTKQGFAEMTMIVVVASLAVIIALSLSLYVEKRKSQSKDKTIRTMTSSKVKNDVVSDNNIFETEHRVIGETNSTEKVIHAEVNVSNGIHSIKFK